MGGKPTEREACLYFLPPSSHKGIYFKRNKLYKIWFYIFSPMLVENIAFKVTKITHIQVTTCSKPCRRLPTVNLTFVNDKIPFFSILCQSSFWSQFLEFILLLGVSFLCRINLDNRVLLVSGVDLLKTKFTISLSELRVDHRFLLLDEYLSVSTRIFFCWTYGGFYHIFWPGQQLPLSSKDLRLNFLLKRTACKNHK